MKKIKENFLIGPFNMTLVKTLYNRNATNMNIVFFYVLLLLLTETAQLQQL